MTRVTRNLTFALVAATLLGVGCGDLDSGAPELISSSLGGSGLKGEYYDNANLTGLRVTRTDATIDFNWGGTAPAAGMGSNTFSVRWSGFVQPDRTETYTFTTHSNDGVRLWVNDVLIVNNWTNHSTREDVGRIGLTAGVAVPIRMEYYDNSGPAVARLFWSSPTIAKQIVPQASLFPMAPGGTGGTGGTGTGGTGGTGGSVTGGSGGVVTGGSGGSVTGGSGGVVTGGSGGSATGGSGGSVTGGSGGVVTGGSGGSVTGGSGGVVTGGSGGSATGGTGGSTPPPTYQVGPTRAYRSLSSLPALRAGDIVEVDGDTTYAGGIVLSSSGTTTAPITFRGVRVNGRRPIISGGTNTVEFAGANTVFQGFEVTGGSARCLYHHANNITVSDTLVRDCPAHGILGADTGSGSLTLEYVEVTRCGSGDTRHQIYIATDENSFPGSVFRMRFSYVHDGNGGNGVKTRAERNEIHYNWIEASYYHELELIGPDPSGGVSESKAREDSDVVGNVIRKGGLNPNHYAVRVGGDGTGQTYGRYRFVNNTILLASGSRAVVRIFNGIDTLEMHNNAIYREGGGGVQILAEDTVTWASGSRLVAGTNNWIPSSSTQVPPEWKNTRTGSTPMLVAIPSDPRPASGSPLIDAALANPPSIAGREFPRPLGTPLYVPPVRRALPLGTAEPRPAVGTLDIGAFERQ